MYRGEQIYGNLRYRVLTPWLARLLPDGLLQLVTSQAAPSAEWFAVAKFAIVNSAFLVLTAATLSRLMWRLGFSPNAVLLGTLLFFTSQPVLQGGGIPMIDPASWLALSLGLVCILERRPALLLMTVCVGMWAKETTVFLAPLALLSSHQLRTRLSLALATVPGVALYLLVRFRLAPDPAESYVNIPAVWGQPMLPLQYLWQLATHPNRLLDLLSSFGLLWWPAAAAYFSEGLPEMLRRWAALIPLLLVVVLLLQSNLGRILFLAFPIVIPMAVLTLRDWLEHSEAREPA